MNECDYLLVSFQHLIVSNKIKQSNNVLNHDGIIRLEIQHKLLRMICVKFILGCFSRVGFGFMRIQRTLFNGFNG